MKCDSKKCKLLQHCNDLCTFVEEVPCLYGVEETWRPTWHSRGFCVGAGAWVRSAGQATTMPYTWSKLGNAWRYSIIANHLSSSHKKKKCADSSAQDKKVKVHISCADSWVSCTMEGCTWYWAKVRARCAQWLVETCMGVAPNLCEGARW